MISIHSLKYVVEASPEEGVPVRRSVTDVDSLGFFMMPAFSIEGSLSARESIRRKPSSSVISASKTELLSKESRRVGAWIGVENEPGPNSVDPLPKVPTPAADWSTDNSNI